MSADPPDDVLAFVAKHIASYEVEGDGGNLRPTPNERVMLADFAIRLLVELAEQRLLSWGSRTSD